MKRCVQTLFLLAVVGAFALGTQVSARATITDDINPMAYAISGNTMYVLLMNEGSKAASGTVVAEVFVDGVAYSASAKYSLDVAQSTTIQLIFGAILDDLDPLGPGFTITDDVDPQNRR